MQVVAKLNYVRHFVIWQNNSTMKKLSLFPLTTLLFITLFYACEKNSIDTTKPETASHIQNEMINFADKIDERGDDASGQIIIYKNERYPSKETYFTNRANEIADILDPIIDKLSSNNGVVTTISENEPTHGSADCKYCTKIGAVSCVKSIANQIPENAEEVHITVSKKDKNGCRTVHAEW